MIKKVATALSALALAAGAQASTVLYSGAGLPTAEQATTAASTTTGPAFIGSFGSGAAGAGELTFTLDGFLSLDGQNTYEDDFTLTVNDVVLFKGTFNLGGGGANVVYSTTPGLSAIGGDPNPGDISWAGGTVNFIVPVTLLAGANTVGFGYTSLDGPGYAGVQGLGDEGWGISNVQVAVVPEPGALALMLAGLGIVGGLARRRGARQA